VNQDGLALPMQPVRRSGGLEVWQKPLERGKLALILFHRNSSAGDGRVVGETADARPAPTKLKPGATLSMGGCSHGVPVVLGGGRIQLKAQPNLCMGVVGECRCANPASPRVGVMACNASDPTQRWSLDASTGQIFSGHARKKDLNSGPICPGERGNSMLLYPAQGRRNVSDHCITHQFTPPPKAFLTVEKRRSHRRSTPTPSQGFSKAGTSASSPARTRLPRPRHPRRRVPRPPPHRLRDKSR
jgi:hypothetical protein